MAKEYTDDYPLQKLVKEYDIDYGKPICAETVPANGNL